MVLFVVHPNSVERLPFTLTESSVLAVIPARHHSTRLPGKILADIAGRPMIEHVYRRASAARLVHAVIVATDDERIASVVGRTDAPVTSNAFSVPIFAWLALGAFLLLVIEPLGQRRRQL